MVGGGQVCQRIGRLAALDIVHEFVEFRFLCALQVPVPVLIERLEELLLLNDNVGLEL